MRNVTEYQANSQKRERAEYLQKQKLDAIPFNTRYRMSNEHTMISSETVKYDGERFYWEINIESRNDSIKPEKNLRGNEMTDDFNMELNAKKIYAWDGENYVRYSPLAEYAFVSSSGQTQQTVNGPLTAGLIPWGLGYYSYDNLAAMQCQAVEKVSGGAVTISLTFTDKFGAQTSVALEPSKDYAMVSLTVTGRGNSVISNEYSDYKYVSGRWVPMFVLIEKYDGVSRRLLERDIWTINSIDAAVPKAEAFRVDYEDDTIIEYASPISEHSLIYSHSKTADTEALLGEKLAFDTREGQQKQNCATGAVKFALSRLGVQVDNAKLAALVDEKDNTTSIEAIQSFIRNLGLDCKVIQTDIETVKMLSDKQIIFYLPEKKHFVVMESIDQYSVRLVDMPSRKFYDRADLNFFDMDWTTGIALVISGGSIRGDFKEVSGAELSSMVGGAGYSCTKLLQQYDVAFCEYIGGSCESLYIEWSERWGCEAAESGSCSSKWMIRYITTPCVNDLFNPDGCKVTGTWTEYWIRACL